MRGKVLFRDSINAHVIKKGRLAAGCWFLSFEGAERYIDVRTDGHWPIGLLGGSGSTG